MERQRSRWGWVFISPWVVGITVFFVWPMIQSVIYSFSKNNVTEKGFELEFVGLDNYLYFFTKDTFFVPNLTESIGGIIPSLLMIL